MQLNISERLLVLNLLPKEGTYANIKEIRKAWETVALTDEDLKAIDHNPETEKFNQTKADACFLELPLSEWITKTIQATLVRMEKEGKLAPAMMSIYEKFVVDHE